MISRSFLVEEFFDHFLTGGGHCEIFINDAATATKKTGFSSLNFLINSSAAFSNLSLKTAFLANERDLSAPKYEYFKCRHQINVSRADTSLGTIFRLSASGGFRFRARDEVEPVNSGLSSLDFSELSI